MPVALPPRARTRARRPLLLLLTALALVLAAGTAVAATPKPAAADVALTHICDPVDPAACLTPFPNDWFTVADATTATGRRVNLSPLATPRSIGLIPIDPAEWNHNDGFSPGAHLITRVQGVDLARSGAAPITDIGASLRADAPIVVVDTATGERWPYWAELDATATDPARRALLIRPAKNFTEGHKYDVLLRNLRDATGAVIAPSATVADLLDGEPWYSPDRERSDALRRTVADLRRLGVSTGGVNLAWDFTVASTRNLTERAVRMRDDAFAKLGAAAPTVSVDEVTNYTPDENANIGRQVVGTVTLPSYLDAAGGPAGSKLNYGPDGLPAQRPGNTQRAKFYCNIPRAAFTTPALPALYGHGLLGSPEEIESGKIELASQEGDVLFCATRWIGMSDEDVVNVASVFADFSRFGTIPDRLQQSYVNFLFLGRAMIHPAGLASLPAFQDDAGHPLVDRAAGLTYAGFSQGGIQGAALAALAQDFTRAVLGVPGINYSTMLNRSSDFGTFQQALDVTYADKLDQQLVFGLLQMLWDRGEGNGYAHHITADPLPGTPVHRVLLHEAVGDHQVANIATEVMARTIQGVHAHQPAFAPGRTRDAEPLWGIPAIPAYPYAGSALVVWDSGSPLPPLGNTPPREGADPHGHTGNTPAARQQAAHFLRTGEVIDTCGGAPCVAFPS